MSSSLREATSAPETAKATAARPSTATESCASPAMSNMLPRPLPESPPALADVLAVPVAPRGRHVEDGALAAQGGDRHLVGVGVDADVIGVALADPQGAAGAGADRKRTRLNSSP